MSNLIVNLRDASISAKSAGDQDGSEVLAKACDEAAGVLKDNSVRDGSEKLIIAFAHFRDSSVSEAQYNAWEKALDMVIEFKKNN